MDCIQTRYWHRRVITYHCITQKSTELCPHKATEMTSNITGGVHVAPPMLHYDYYSMHNSTHSRTDIDEIKPLLRMQACHLLDNSMPYSFWKKKNKGKKRAMRWWSYNMERNNLNSFDATRTVAILHQYITPEYIARETSADIYVLCPFHEEKTASCAISKTSNVVKCFWCGKSYMIPTFLSIVLGNSRHRREQKILDPWTTTTNPSQLLLFTQKELMEMLIAKPPSYANTSSNLQLTPYAQTPSLFSDDTGTTMRFDDDLDLPF